MIHVLDQKTIDKIAAGEVIERPASVVKELVENAVDAKANRITIEVKDGGISYIRVTDNGGGISHEEVQKAFLRHATSKLRDAEDLVGVATLGFRGEALSTISAVTRTEMITKTPESLTGTKYVIHGGKEIELCEAGAPDGTTVVCRDIFFNTPARLKFLKSSMTEGSYINDLATHIALSHPEVSITMISNGKTIFSTTGKGNLKDTIYTLYGRDITSSLLPVDYSDGALRVTGFIGKPFLSRGNRSFENYFVNDRYIKSQVVNRAIEEGYKTYIMQHRFPFTVLFLHLPGEDCDVNVHPTKKEFKYQNEKALFSVVFHAIQDALKDKTLIPDMTTDYGAKDKIYRGNPDLLVREDERPAAFPGPGSKSSPAIARESASAQGPVSAPEPAVAPGYAVPSGEDLPHTMEGAAKPAGQNVFPRPMEGAAKPAGQTVFPRPMERAANAANQMVNEPSFGHPGDSYSILEALMPKDFREELKRKDEEKQAEQRRVEADARALLERQKESFRQAELTDETYLSGEAEPEVYVIGLAFNTYWITQYKDTLYLMDQHAAHEKVNYERFLAEYKKRTIHSQRIFPPKIITLSAADKEAVIPAFPLLEKAGFEIEDFGGNEVKLSALPANLLGLSGEDVFYEMVAYISAGIENVTEDIFVRKIATMGCKAAVKGNQRISVEEVKALLKELLTLDNPYNCPHGRPTIIRMTKEELDKQFKRIVE